jgi:hypothetical protein
MAKKKDNAAVASLCGLVLRRLQDDVGVTGTIADDTPVTVADLSKIFGEALEQFTREEKKAPSE